MESIRTAQADSTPEFTVPEAKKPAKPRKTCTIKPAKAAKGTTAKSPKAAGQLGKTCYAGSHQDFRREEARRTDVSLVTLPVQVGDIKPSLSLDEAENLYRTLRAYLGVSSARVDRPSRPNE